MGLKGRRETLRRTSRRTFKLEQRPERAHDKAQLRCVPASVFSFPFSCFASVVGKRTQLENNRPYLFCCFVTTLKSHDCLLQNSFKIDLLYGRSKKMSTKETFSLVCYTAVFSVVTQRSSPLAAAENRITFLSFCVCGLTNKTIMYKKLDNT